MLSDEIRAAMLNIENLARAYMITKRFLAEQYGEEFLRLSKDEQALATGKILSDLLGI